MKNLSGIVLTVLVGLAPITPAVAEMPGSPTKTDAPAARNDGILNLVRGKLASEPPATEEHERDDQKALTAFYGARHGSPLWVTSAGLKPEAKLLAAEIANAWTYALDVDAFALPSLVNGELPSTDSTTLADAEIQYSKAALHYVRDARGGRIPDPSEMLTTEFDRRPQWIDPKQALAALAATHEPDAYLRSIEPQHEQFYRLRKLYVSMVRGKDGKPKPLTAAAKRLRANMEMWRWMWLDMGDYYVLNNVPEYMQYVYKDGKIIRRAKIVVGEVGKQTTIFSRPLKYVVLRPLWIIPESIKVNELWPNLIRGGSMMRQYGLEIETKSGDPVNWRNIDWANADIRKFRAVQPPGPKSVLGHVKFSFPSQHTIYMHDTPDKWMFRQAQRTLSHGCLRVQNPMQLAEMILKEDKGWDKAKVEALSRSGPRNNEIPITKEIPIHIVYFTAWVDDDGHLKTFRDIYGHEKRITLALDGKWDKINKGRDHLAPVEPDFDPQALAARVEKREQEISPSAQKGATIGDMIGQALGMSF